MILPIIALVIGSVLFLFREYLPESTVLIYPCLAAAPVIAHQFFAKRELGRLWGAAFFADLHDVYISILSTTSLLSFVLWLYVSEEKMMFAVQRPQLYAEYLAFTQHAGYAVLLFCSGFTIGHRFFLKGTRQQALNILECELPDWVYRRVDADRLAFIICLLSALTYGCRIYAFSRGQTSFDSDVDFGQLGRFWSLFAIISSLGVMCPGAMFVLSTRYDSKFIRIVAWALLGVEMMFGAYFGSKSIVLLPAITSFIGYSIGKRRLPKFRQLFPVVCIVVLLALTAQATRFAYREGLQTSSDEYLSYWRATLLGDSSLSSGASSSQGASYYVSRFNIAVPIFGAASYVDRAGPAYQFSGYFNAALSLVPSFFFPWKPLPFAQNEFGRRTGMLADGDLSTSVRPTIVGDAYYNFGIIGCAVVGMVCGLLTAGIYRFANTMIVYGKPLMIYTIIFSLIDIENSFSNAYGGLIKNTMLIMVALRVSATVPMMAKNFSTFAGGRGLEIRRKWSGSPERNSSSK